MKISPTLNMTYGLHKRFETFNIATAISHISHHLFAPYFMLSLRCYFRDEPQEKTRALDFVLCPQIFALKNEGKNLRVQRTNPAFCMQKAGSLREKCCARNY